MRVLSWALLAFSLFGCASGDIRGSVDKTTTIWVEPLNTKDTKFSGGDLNSTYNLRTKIEQKYNQEIADALVKKGYVAKAANGTVKRGVVLSGTVLRVERGTASAHYFVGMDARNLNIVSQFVLTDRGQKKTLSEFEITGDMESGAKKIADDIDASLSPAPKK